MKLLGLELCSAKCRYVLHFWALFYSVSSFLQTDINERMELHQNVGRFLKIKDFLKEHTPLPLR